MIWVVLTGIVVLGLVLILWLPWEIEINTLQNVYQMRWKGVIGASVRVDKGNSTLKWYYQLFGWHREWHPVFGLPRAKGVNKVPAQKAGTHWTFRQIISLLKKLFSAVKVKRFYVNWDTDDFIYNAYLYPLTHAIHLRNGRFQINFTGQHDLNILLQTRLCRLAWAYLQVLFSFKMK